MKNEARSHDIVDEIARQLQNWASFYARRHFNKAAGVTSSMYWRFDPVPSGPPRDAFAADLYERALCELKGHPKDSDYFRHWLIVKYEYVYRWASATAAQKMRISRATYYQDRKACFHWLDGRVNRGLYLHTR